MEVKRQSETLFLYDDDVSEGYGEYRINLPFTPKTVTVSNVRYLFSHDPADREVGLSFVKSDIITSVDGTLCSFMDGTDNSTPITFKCRPDISGMIRFDYTQVGGRGGELSLALTFED